MTLTVPDRKALRAAHDEARDRALAAVDTATCAYQIRHLVGLAAEYCVHAERHAAAAFAVTAAAAIDRISDDRKAAAACDKVAADAMNAVAVAAEVADAALGFR